MGIHVKRRARVLFLNDYPMAEALAAWRTGAYPAQHLWGAHALADHGFDVITPKFSTSPALTRFMQRRLPESWGDCDQQIRALVRSDYDLVYAACQTTTGLLARLGSHGLFRKPIVALLHHRLDDTPGARAFVRGHTSLPCLSRGVTRQMVEVFEVPATRASTLDWGPDLEFYGPVEYPDEMNGPVVVSAGKTNRDHDTLAAAVRDSDLPVTILGTPPTATGVSRRTQVVAATHVPYRELLRIYQKASLIAIPLIQNPRMSGLTGLLDAMALGRPVIMTRNPLIDIDIEAEGIGLWVEPGDVEGWRTSLLELAADQDRRREMGRRARALAEKRCNIGIFTDQLASVLTDALGDRGARC